MRRAARRPAADAGERRDRSARRRRCRLSATSPMCSGSRTRRTSRCSSATPASCGRPRPATGCSSRHPAGDCVLVPLRCVPLDRRSYSAGSRLRDAPRAVCTDRRASRLPAVAGELQRHAREAGAVAAARSSRSRRRCARADGAPLGDLFALRQRPLLPRQADLRAPLRARRPIRGNPIVGSGIHVITPNAGLRSAGHAASPTRRCAAFARGDIDAENARYRRPLETSARALLRGDRARLRRRAARQRRVAEVRRRARATIFGDAAALSGRVRRPRRHEPRRPAAASRARRRRARLRPGARRGPPRRAAAEAAADPMADARLRLGRSRAAQTPVEAQPFDSGEGRRA